MFFHDSAGFKASKFFSVYQTSALNMCQTKIRPTNINQHQATSPTININSTPF